VRRASAEDGRRGAAAALAIGFSLLAPQTIAAAAPDDTGSAEAAAGRVATGSVAAGSVAAGSGRQAQPHRPVTRPSRSKNAAASRVAAPTRRTAVAKAVKPNPIVALFFNHTPTLNPTQNAPGPDGVVHGALNAQDPDGNTLTYSVVHSPAHGQVVIDGDGQFVYTPANPGQLAASDTFGVQVSDAGHGFHLHGVLGLVNLMTFGLLGSAGHITTRTVNLSLAAPIDPTSYVLPVAPGVTVKTVHTVGDSPSGQSYPMVGSPDGLGLFDNNDGTFTLLMNHELGSGAGAVRAHGATGAFISRYVIDKNTLEVLAGNDLIQRVFAWNAGTQASDAASSTVGFSRFCSGDLAAASAFSHNGSGTSARIFLTGEEGGAGRAVATVVTGAGAGNSYVLGTFSPGTNGSGLAGVASWENLLASPYGQDKTVVIGNNDGGSGIMNGALAVYVGTKQNTGSDADRAGLTNGTLSFVSVAGNSAEITDPTTRATAITNGTPFTLSSVASTAFSRPEDGAWNPLNPNEYYFTTTDRLDQASDGVGSQVGRSRLWRLTFSDITNPGLGGTIDLLVDGDAVDGAKVNMLDNLAVDRNGRILLQEDTGGAAHNAKIWQYDVATDSLTLLAKHDPARFGDIGLPATDPFTADEESSGIVDAQDVLGPGWFLLTVMAHYPLGGGLVEGGQLLALYSPVSG
jgi:hypothetical protein